MTSPEKNISDETSTLRGYIRAESIPVPRDLMTRSYVRTVLYGGLPFLFIALSMAIGAANPVGWPVALGLAFFPILAAQRCFQTMVHDLSHLLFLPGRKANDAVGNLLVAGFIGMRIQNYWRVHAVHHTANGSADDPEFVDFAEVKERGGLIPFIIGYALGWQAVSLIKKYYFQKPDSRAAGTGAAEGSRLVKLVGDTWHVAVCHAVLLYLFAGVAGTWYLYLLWLYVAVTWSPMLSKLRFLVEHPSATDLTVSTRAPWWERLYFAPYNFNYHFEHHVWPSLPPYRLRRAHETLTADGYFDRHPEYLGRSYVGALLRQQAL